MPPARKRTARSKTPSKNTNALAGFVEQARILGNVLIADAQRDICDLVSEYLSEEGYVVSQVSTSSDLLSYVAHNQFDLIIMESHFPDKDGFDVIKEVRAITSTPIIILTGHFEIVDRILGLEMGADDYLPKPFHLRELRARSQAVMRRSRMLTLKPRIERTITFRPEHYQAGLQILSYFHTIVAKKYPNRQVTISIHQIDNSIRLIIETESGGEETIEQVLDDYADVVFGKKPPEALLSDPIDIMELRYKLDLASAELRLQRQLHDHTKEQYEARIISLEDQVMLLNKSLYLGMSREQKLVQLIERWTTSLSDKSTVEALRLLEEKLRLGVTEADEKAIKQAASTLSKEKRVFAQILGIAKEIVSRSGGHLLSEWIIAIANSLPH